MVSGAPTGQMVVEVRLFAVLRERVGLDAMELQLRAGATVDDALGRLRQQPPLDELLERVPVVVAVNRDYAAGSTVLVAGDELALIPPVSGGDHGGPSGNATSDAVHVLISSEALDLARASNAVADDRAGAIAIFQGVTREVALLHYEAYVEMAGPQIERIAAESLRCFGLCAVAVEHRVGDVATGEPSVIVAASAPHRAEAFDGAREIIDRLKGEVTIWKQEHDGLGKATWVAGAEPGA